MLCSQWQIKQISTGYIEMLVYKFVIRWLVILCNTYLHRWQNCGTLIGTLVSLAAADPAKPEPEVLRDVDARPHSIAQPISNALQIKTRLLIETACFVVRGSRVIGP